MKACKLDLMLQTGNRAGKNDLGRKGSLAVITSLEFGALFFLNQVLFLV